MQTSVSKVPPPPPAFSPVKLEITFQTQAELDALAALFCYTAINDPLRNLAGFSAYDRISVPLQENGANYRSSFDELTKKIETHSALVYAQKRRARGDT